jgi:restriction endonuclease S subunit
LATKDAPSRARRLIKEKDILVSTVRPNLKAFAFIKNPPDKTIASTGFAVLRATERILPEYLYAIIFDDKSVSQMIQLMGKGSYPSINQSDVESLQIPLPPLEIQRQIVDEIAAHQRILDGARQVVAGWNPNLELELNSSLPDGVEEWKKVKLGDICDFMTGGTPTTTVKEYYENGKIPWLVSGDIHNNEIVDCKGRITKKGLENSNARFLPRDSVMIALNGQGKTRATVALLRIENATCSQSLVSINPADKNILLSEFLYYQLKSMYQQIRNLTGDNQRSGLNMPILKTIEIPLPPLEIQRAIVARLERERLIVDGNRQLIRLYEEKIKKITEKVWHA